MNLVESPVVNNIVSSYQGTLTMAVRKKFNPDLSLSHDSLIEIQEKRRIRKIKEDIRQLKMKIVHFDTNNFVYENFVDKEQLLAEMQSVFEDFVQKYNSIIIQSKTKC